MKLKPLLRMASLLLAAAMLVPTQAGAQSRKRSGTKRKTTTTAAAIPAVKQSNKTLSKGSTTVTICHYDAPAYYKLAEPYGHLRYSDDSFSIDWPTEVSGGSVRQLQQWLIKKACSGNYATPVPQNVTSLIKLRNTCEDDARRVAKIPKTESDWMMDCQDVSLSLLTSNVMMVNCENAIVTDGSMSGTYYHYYYYDLAAQKELEASDLFKSGATSLIAKRLKADDYWDIPGLEFKSKPYIPKNFKIRHDSVTFRIEELRWPIEVPVSLNDLRPYGTPKLQAIIDELQGKSPAQAASGNAEGAIYKSVEQPPTYPGGEAALVHYLRDNIKYPETAWAQGIQGRVVVQFVVEKDGSVGEVKVVHSVNQDLDNEAIRVCKNLSKFTPGRHNGQLVRVWYTLPINFSLATKK